MNHENWRPVVNGVLYGVKFQGELDDGLADRMAQRIIRSPLAGMTAEEQYSALVTAVESGTELTRMEAEERAEADVREFLARIVDRLDALRPWEEPPHQRVDLHRWEDFAEPVMIARLAMDFVVAGEKIGTFFGRLPDIETRGIALRLRSGVVVGLVADWWPDSEEIAVFSRGTPERPDEVVRELVAATTLASSDFRLVSE